MEKRTLRKRAPWATVVAALLFSTIGEAPGMSGGPHRSSFAHAAGYERSTGDPSQSRSVTLATNGIVASSHPLASQAGLRVLEKGGTAADAAIAASAMLGVVEPMSCGIGGDLFVIYWDAKTGAIHGLNGSGRSPAGLNRQVFADRGLAAIPEEGLLSWSVPGCVHGWETLHRRFGALPWSDLLQPSIAAAENGFPVTEIIAGYWQTEEAALRRWPDSARTYLPGGRAPRFGEVFRNPALAASYRLIAAQGASAFYQGPIAESLVAFSKANGGYFSLEDLRSHSSEWTTPVSTSYRGYEVFELPPNGQGIAVLQMLNMLEPFDLAAFGPGHPEYLHLLIEAKKLAFADRAKYYADPAFAALPTEELISKEYAQRRLSLLRRDRAADDVAPGDVKLTRGDTIYLSVVDKDRNCCSLIQSIYFPFGSKVTPGDLGFAMQNRGALFALDDSHLNRLAPGKRPFHTIIPALVAKNGKPWLCFGVMGGDMQPQGHVQVLVNLIDFGMNVQAAGDAARIRHDGGATPTGVHKPGVGTVYVERGISEEATAQLQAKGHVVVRGKAGVGGYQGILIDWENGVLHGATEARKDGAAVGY